MSDLAAFFQSIKLPVISQAAHALIQSLNNEDVQSAELRDIVSRDPALSAQLLRLANSAHFGLPRGVGTLDEAIAMVGISQVRALALGACLNGSFPTLAGLDRNEFWNSSMACAGYSQWLALSLGMDGQTAWLTGMMLRLGELLIAQAQPQVLAEIERLPQLPGARWDRERRLVGFSEGQITAELAHRWNFPMQIVQALQRSYDPLSEQAFSRLGAIVHLAGLLADAPDATPQSLDMLPQDVVRSLQLDLESLRSHFPAADSFLKIGSH